MEAKEAIMKVLSSCSMELADGVTVVQIIVVDISKLFVTSTVTGYNGG